MKHSARILFLSAILTLLFSISFNETVLSQPPPPPPPGGGHGEGGNQPAGGAPIGDGVYLLIGLAGLYGGKKVYDARKAFTRETE